MKYYLEITAMQCLLYCITTEAKISLKFSRRDQRLGPTLPAWIRPDQSLLLVATPPIKRLLMNIGYF